MCHQSPEILSNSPEIYAETSSNPECSPRSRLQTTAELHVHCVQLVREKSAIIILTQQGDNCRIWMEAIEFAC
jgi:hypothetical protein